MVTLEEKFDGHIILYCKGHYRVEGVDFITGLQRIWAVRCGLNNISNNLNEYIADRMYNIFKLCNPKKVGYFQDILHKGLCDEWRYGDLTPINRCIMVYMGELLGLQIEDGDQVFIKLPKPQKQLFKRIVNGKARHGDYEKVK